MQWTELADVLIASLWMRAAFVVSIVLLYEGTSRAASGHARRSAIWMIVGGSAICLTSGTAMVVLGNKAQKASAVLDSPSLKVPPLPPLPPDWGSDLSPEARESNSRALASLAFVSSGTIREYVDREGKWSLYSPVESDIKGRDEMAASRARLDLIPTLFIRAAADWYIAGVLSAALGCWIGYRRRRIPANLPLEPTAEKRGG
jgi:hypothetical protein